MTDFHWSSSDELKALSRICHELFISSRCWHSSEWISFGRLHGKTPLSVKRGFEKVLGKDWMYGATSEATPAKSSSSINSTRHSMGWLRRKGGTAPTVSATVRAVKQREWLIASRTDPPGIACNVFNPLPVSATNMFFAKGAANKLRARSAKETYTNLERCSLLVGWRFEGFRPASLPGACRYRCYQSY